MKRIALVLAAALLGCVAIPAMATPITFTFTSTNMGGTLGGTTVIDETLTVTAVADTADVLNCSGVLLYAGSCGFSGGLTGSFTWGSSTGTFTNLLYVFNNTGNNVLGFGINADNLDAVFPGDSTYDMVSAFGPATVSGVSMDFTGSDYAATSLGALVASGSGPNSSTTFMATLGSPIINASEPGELGLFGLGLLGLLGLAFKRRG